MNNKFFKSTLAALGLSLLLGCQTTPPPYAGGLGADGLPAARYRIGGGLNVKFTAPVKGLAYVVEDTSHKLLSTTQLNEKDDFENAMDLTGEETQQNLAKYGINVNAAKFSVYFVPVIEPKEKE